MLLRNEERILVDLKFPGDKFSSVQVFSDNNIETWFATNGLLNRKH